MIAVLIVALLAGAAFLSPVQTWVAQLALDRRPELHGKVGSVSADLGGVSVEDLHLEYGGAVLRMPSLEAKVPVAAAVRGRRLPILGLVAKGWTLEMRETGESGEAAPGGRSAAKQAVQAARLLGGILGRWRLPVDATIDGVDFEGTVLVDGPSGMAPYRTHIKMSGGGIGAGRGGALSFEATFVNPPLPTNLVRARGSVALGLDPRGIPGRVEIKADLAADGGSFPDGYAVSADATVVRAAEGESFTLDLKRGERHVAALDGRLAKGSHRISGSWRADLRDADLEPFVPSGSLPKYEVAGEGRFEADRVSRWIHVTGGLKALVDRLGAVAPELERLGPAMLGADFDVSRAGRSVRIDRLEILVAGRSGVLARALQPFEWDPRTREVRPSNPQADWVECSAEGLPLAWLSAVTDRVAFEGGDAKWDFIIRTENGGFALRPKKPLTAAGVSVRTARGVVASGLDLSLSLSAGWTPKGWRALCAPFAVSKSGRRLATVEAEMSRDGGAGGPVSVSGTWTADLGAFPALRGLGGRSASGDFKANLGNPTTVEGKLAVAGRDPDRTATASLRADVGGWGAVGFYGPVTIRTGQAVSEITTEGTWTGGSEPEVFVKLTGEKAALGHLRLLVGALAAAGGAPANRAEGRDEVPFWGTGAGRLAVSFDRLLTGAGEFKAVSGIVHFGRGSVRLEDGAAALPERGQAEAEGSISFDPAASAPYELKATVSVSDADSRSFLKSSKAAQEPVIEGRFAAAGTIAGKGMNRDDLAANLREEFRVTGASAILRLLKTSVAEAIPETPTSVVKDTLGSVGSFMGKVLNVEKRETPSGNTAVAKETDAVLNLTYQLAEIGCDKFSVTAVREPGRGVRMADIAIEAQDEKLSGAGRMGWIAGKPLADQELSLDLRLGVRNGLADLASAAGLIAGKKDGAGFAWFGQTIHFRGTLGQVDGREWREILLKAALPKNAANGKSGR